MRLQTSTSSSEEQDQQQEEKEMDYASGEDDDDHHHHVETAIDRAMANLTTLARGIAPGETQCRQPLTANTLDDASRYVTPPRTLERLLSPVPATIQVPSTHSNEQPRDGLMESIHFATGSMRFDFPYVGPVSEASTVEAEASQEPETREYQRNVHPWQRHYNHHRQQQRQHLQPIDTKNKKSTGLAAGLATSIIMTILFGFRIGLMAGLFAAYANDKEGTLGDISRALGEIALLTHEKAIDINTRHKLGRRVRFALMIGWECATTIDRKNNACMNMIVHGDVVLKNTVDAFHFHERFHGHRFLQDMDEDILAPPFRHVRALDDDITAPFDVEPVELLRRASNWQ